MSLRRLAIEQIALYQFHRPDPAVPFAESIGALVALRDEGKIRHIGLSNVTPSDLAAAQEQTPIVSIQNRYNPSDRASEKVVDQCADEQLAFLPWAPIQGTDTDALAEVSARHGISTRQAALAWLLARSPCMLPIPGTGSVEHLEANIAAAAVRFSDDDVAALR